MIFAIQNSENWRTALNRFLDSSMPLWIVLLIVFAVWCAFQGLQALWGRDSVNDDDGGGEDYPE